MKEDGAERARLGNIAAAKIDFDEVGMSVADRIYDEVRTLPESQAREVLDFITTLKARRHANAAARRAAALKTLARYRGRLEAARSNRDELYDRKVLR
jgi:hypothetical protein